MRRFIALLLVFAIGCPACFAGNGPDQKHVEKIKKQVSTYMKDGSTVSIETYDQHQMRGTIAEAGPETFVLTAAGKSVTLQYADIKKLKGAPSREEVEQIKNQVSKYLENGRTVSIETYDQHQMRGAIVEADPETFVLTEAGKTLTLRYADIKKLKGPMSPEAKAGIRTAIILGVVIVAITLALAQDR